MNLPGSARLSSKPAIASITTKLLPLFETVNDWIEPGSGWTAFRNDASLTKTGKLIEACAHFFPKETCKPSGPCTIQPSENLHRMQRKTPYWLGDFFSASMILDMRERSGPELDRGKYLDLGCSSGSLLRVLAACKPNADLHGRDPGTSAIEWAQENIPGAQFAPMGLKPRRDFADAEVDGITAVSEWSRHREDAARIWLDEAARI